MRLVLLAVLAVGLTLAACGGDSQTSPGGSAQGPGISIDEALDYEGEEPVLVNGGLLADDRDVRLCSALAESFPPQCAGASLRVEGLDLATLPDLQTHGGVTWSDRPVQLLGTVEGGVLTVTGQANA